MVQFIREVQVDKLSPKSRQLQTVSVKIDSKGRISIPAWVRRNYGLDEGMELGLKFDLGNQAILLIFDGQDGVEYPLREKGNPACAEGIQVSTKGCGPFRASSIGLRPDNLAPGPSNKNRGEEYG